jgi:hypothetical protein
MGNLARKYMATILLDPPVQQNCLTIVVTLYNIHNMLLLSRVIQFVVSLNRELHSVSWDLLSILMPMLANSHNTVSYEEFACCGSDDWVYCHFYYNYNQLQQLTISDCLRLAPFLTGLRVSSLLLWRKTKDESLATESLNSLTNAEELTVLNWTELSNDFSVANE